MQQRWLQQGMYELAEEKQRDGSAVDVSQSNAF